MDLFAMLSPLLRCSANSAILFWVVVSKMWLPHMLMLYHASSLSWLLVCSMYNLDLQMHLERCAKRKRFSTSWYLVSMHLSQFILLQNISWMKRLTGYQYCEVCHCACSPPPKSKNVEPHTSTTLTYLFFWYSGVKILRYCMIGFWDIQSELETCISLFFLFSEL